MNDLQLYKLYCSIPLWNVYNQSRIYPEYVVITGRAFRAPHPHRHYTLEEFIDKLEKGSRFQTDNIKLMSNYTIRFGYCPPSPGPHKSTGCMWFNNIKDAIEAYYDFRLDRRVPIYIKFGNSAYRKISFEWLLEHENNL